MARSSFEELRVYQLSETLSDHVWNMVTQWSQFSRDTVGEQIVTAADSVGANIAEGVGRGSYRENRRFVKIARGSLNETKHFLRRAYHRKLITDEQTAQLKPILDSLAPMLNAYLNSIGPRRREHNDDHPNTINGPDS